MKKLDEYFSYFKNRKIVLVKIDTEGTEIDVFLGGLQLIKELKIPFIELEFYQDKLKAQGNNPRKLLELLNEMGYIFSQTNFTHKFITRNELLNKKIHFISIYCTLKEYYEKYKALF